MQHHLEGIQDSTVIRFHQAAIDIARCLEGLDTWRGAEGRCLALAEVVVVISPTDAWQTLTLQQLKWDLEGSFSDSRQRLRMRQRPGSLFSTVF